MAEPDSAGPTVVANRGGAGGQPLPATERAFFEPRFGHDLGHVRIHSDATATRAAGALAFTQGANIVFRPDRYQPRTNEGRRLLAHELTHVLQATRGTPPGKHDGPRIAQRLGPGAPLQREPDPEADDTSLLSSPSSDEGHNPPDAVDVIRDAGDTGLAPPAPATGGGGGGSGGGGEITVETGNNTGGSGNRKLHQQICVRTAAGAAKDCFSFGTDFGFQAPQFSSTWLGWDSYVVGAILRGEIYNPSPVAGATIASVHTPTTAQAARWLSYMRGTRLGTQDGYSVARHNCRMFSQLEFRDAPLHW